MQVLLGEYAKWTCMMQSKRFLTAVMLVIIMFVNVSPSSAQTSCCELVDKHPILGKIMEYFPFIAPMITMMEPWAFHGRLMGNKWLVTGLGAEEVVGIQLKNSTEDCNHGSRAKAHST